VTHRLEPRRFKAVLHINYISKRKENLETSGLKLDRRPIKPAQPESQPHLDLAPPYPFHAPHLSSAPPPAASSVLENENCRDKNVVKGANFLIDLKVLLYREITT